MVEERKGPDYADYAAKAAAPPLTTSESNTIKSVMALKGKEVTDVDVDDDKVTIYFDKTWLTIYNTNKRDRANPKNLDHNFETVRRLREDHAKKKKNKN